MLFLNEDLPMRRDAASRFIVGDGDKWKVCAERFEEDLSALAAPDFDDVLVHVLVLIFSRADGDRLPCDLNAVPVSFGIRPTRTGVIRRHGKFYYPGIDNGEHLPIALHIKKLCVDPAFVLVIHPDPVIGVGATDDLYIRAFNQSVEIEIFSAWSIPAAQ